MKRIAEKIGLSVADLSCVILYWFAAALPLILEILNQTK